MARVADIVSVALVACYVAGSPVVVRWRPVVIEEPFVAWHKGVNTFVAGAEAVVRHSGHALGTTLKQAILSTTFLGRAGA